MDLEVSNLDQSEGGNMRGGHWQKKTDERGGGRKEDFLILKGVSVTPPSQMQRLRQEEEKHKRAS